MADTITARLRDAPIIPLIQANDVAAALSVAEALTAGGLSVIEIVLRTPGAISCLQRVASELPQAMIGAGTVLTADQALEVVDAGAMFVVSPGLDESVVDVARSAGLPVFPGISTATELQRAWNLGLRAVKFFPANASGGVAMLKALGSVFKEMRFMPTGGVSAENLAEYLALPSVLACGGSWLTPGSAISAGNFGAVKRLAEEALIISQGVRKFGNG